MDKDRTFYSNHIVASTSEQETLLVFKLKPAGIEGDDPELTTEVARVYLPTDLAVLFFEQFAPKIRDVLVKSDAKAKEESDAAS